MTRSWNTVHSRGWSLHIAPVVVVVVVVEESEKGNEDHVLILSSGAIFGLVVKGAFADFRRRPMLLLLLLELWCPSMRLIR